MTNTIKITRKIDGITVTARATYREFVDGWDCTVRQDLKGPIIERRGSVSDAPLELWDMIELAIEDKRSELAFNARPFSTAQSRG